MKKIVSLILAFALILPLTLSLSSCSLFCMTCFGRGDLRCGVCDGKEQIRCTNCGGDGEAPCSLCGGTGSRTCIMCSGTGLTMEYDFYSGTYKTEFCTYCVGGKTSCLSTQPCYCGDGKTFCDHCDDGRVDCPDC